MVNPASTVRAGRVASDPLSGESPNAKSLGFSLVHEQHGTVVRVRVRGELDIASGPVFENAIEGYLSGPVTALVLDFAGLSYLDSSGLRSLLRVHRLATTRRSRLYIVGVRERVRRVLSMVQFELIVALCTEEGLPASCRWPAPDLMEPSRPGRESDTR